MARPKLSDFVPACSAACCPTLCASCRDTNNDLRYASLSMHIRHSDYLAQWNRSGFGEKGELIKHMDFNMNIGLGALCAQRVGRHECTWNEAA